jgi:selenocysteine lyase/cysteine desulfurase
MEIANPLLDYLSNRSDIRLIGKKTITGKDRAPTIAFTMKNKSSKDLSSELVKHGIATRNDNFYAWRCLMALGINVDDGVVRTSMVHYNSHEDVNKLINALKQI